MWMAREVVERLLDDLDGTDAAETVRFGLDGRQYEIDLNSDNADALREAFAPYVSAARQAATDRGGRRGAAVRPRTDANRTNDIRNWARDHGFKVSDRGRISKEIIEAYDAAH